MPKLSVLGSLSLRVDGEAQAHALLGQPKRFAVFLYLTLARPRGAHQRDTLLALFWPEFDTGRARNALSQVLHHLRRALGAGVVQNRGSELLQVDRSQLVCDAVSFDQLVQERCWADALALYQGDLLPGFHLADLPDFERWLSEERDYLRQQARRAAGEIARACERDGDHPGAVSGWRRALELSPEDESVLRRLMSAQAAQGDRAGARQSYEVFARRLAAEFGVRPDDQTRALAGSLFPPSSAVEPESDRPAIASTPSPAAAPAPPKVERASRRMRIRTVAVPIVAAALLLLLAPLARVARERRMPLDPRLVAVLPFDLVGADSSLSYLQEGMVDLFATRLAGSVLTAVNPRVLLTAWQRQAGRRGLATVSVEESRRLGRRLGAAHLLMGSIVGPPDRPTLSGRLVSVADGKVVATAEASGPIDSLPDLVDQLAAAVLAGFSTEPRERLAELMSASLPALERYLVARDAYRHGSYTVAAAALRSAVQLDSNFALAWLHLADAGDWVGSPDIQAARERAWALRGHLAPSDRAYLEALVGPRYPVVPSLSDRLSAWERVVAQTPDRAEAWYGLGDILFHNGAFLEADSGFRRAQAAFERAVALDSGYAAPLAHLVEIAVVHGDRPASRRLAAMYRQVDSTGDVAEFLEWRLALAAQDTAVLRGVRERLPGFSTPALRRIVTWSQLEGVGVSDGMRSLDLILARPATEGERVNALDVSVAPLGNAGRFDRLVAVIEARAGGYSLQGRGMARLRVVHQYATDAELVDSLVRGLSVAPGSEDGLELAQVHALSRSLAGVAVAPGDFATVVEGMLEQRWDDVLIHAAGAFLKAACCPADARATIDSVNAELPSYLGAQSSVLIYLAGAYERLGEPKLALRTIRRRSLDHWFGLPRLSQSLLLEGRVAAEAGDTATAIQAYRHYLVLRDDPDPNLRREVGRVRTLLSALEGRPVAGR